MIGTRQLQRVLLAEGDERRCQGGDGRRRPAAPGDRGGGGIPPTRRAARCRRDIGEVRRQSRAVDARRDARRLLPAGPARRSVLTGKARYGSLRRHARCRSHRTDRALGRRAARRAIGAVAHHSHPHECKEVSKCSTRPRAQKLAERAANLVSDVAVADRAWRAPVRRQRPYPVPEERARASA